MTKKYRLVIPDKIGKNQSYVAIHYSDRDGEIVDYATVSELERIDLWDWLKEVGEEKIESAEEWIEDVWHKNTWQNPESPNFNKLNMMEAYEAGDKNKALKHAKTKEGNKIFDELAHINHIEPNNADYESAKCWFALGWEGCFDAYNLGEL